MKIINKSRVLERYLVIGLLTIASMFLSITPAKAAEFCGDSYYINETLPNGARWDMCWEHRQREGIIFHHVFYTPNNGQRRMIFNHAAVAQIHVPYDDNGARYHDISDYGIGGNNMLDLQADECPSGSLLQFSGKNVLCKQIKKRQIAYKSGSNSLSGNNLSLFSVSPVGAYYYISTWRFMDDGTIEPAIGATGSLQRFGSNQSRGWKMGDNRVGIAHLHNFYWKLDFDLNETHLDDVVEEINFTSNNGKRQRSITVFNSEVSRKVNPESMRRWRVRDKTLKNSNNHSMSYDILINESGHQDIGPSSEPFTQNDFYVTKQNNAEKFASHNPSGGKNLAEFTNGESLVNNDIVVWAGVTFYHMPRSEDAPHMDAHWSHIKIVPRDWHASNPIGNSVSNTAPNITTPPNQSTLQGNSVSFNIQASDIDGDSLNYSANGLPSGLQINSSTGLISGIVTNSGIFTVSVSVNDGSETTSTQFTWEVTAVNTNNPPQITTPSNQSGQVGDSVNLTIQANDSDGDVLSYSATGLPAGLTINSSTGLISGTLSLAAISSVSISVSDSTATTSVQFNWNVSALPGVISNQVTNNAITINGSVGDWSGISYYNTDPDDVSGALNQIDWLKVAIAHSPQNVFINYQNRGNVDPNNTSGSYIPWGWTAYLDTDNDASTGYIQNSIGADYIISGNVIERYIGTGTSWSWGVVTSSTLQYSGSNVEMSFPRSAIGNPQNMRAVFIGDNSVFNGDSTDQYPDSGSFSYAFTGVSNPNSAPVANNQQISVSSGSSISLVLSATDSDFDALSYEVTTQPQHGSLSGSAPNIVYTADNNYIGADSFKFKANDGTVDSQLATININVTSGQPSGAVSNYVSSPIVVNGDESDWAGLDSFENDANDASGNIDWQNVTLAHDNSTFYLKYKNHGNVDPDSISGSYLAWGWQTFIDSDKNPATGYRTGAIGADYVLEGNQVQKYTGSGSNWSWQTLGPAESRYSNNIAEISLPRSQIGNPTSMRVVFSGDSSSYAGSGVDLYPNGQNNSQASTQYFEYDFSGGNGGNDRPVASTQSVTVNSGESINITLIGSDANNDALTYNVVSNPTNGSLTGLAPNIVYTPTANFVGQDSLSFNVSDGSATSSTAVVNINVTDLQNGIYSNLVSSITIDGNNEEWSGLSAFGLDGDDISGVNNIIDWQRAATAHNASNLYFLYQSYNSVSVDNNSGSFINWGWQTYLDTDENSSTGYQIGNVGADYIIEGTQLQRYTGSGNDWSWNNFATSTVQYNSNTVELSFARSLINNPSKLRIVFIGNNGSYGGTNTDTYPNNLEYFEYQLSGGTQASSNRPVANEMTLAVTPNESRTFSLSAQDQDNDDLTYRIIGGPSNGVVAGNIANGNSISYTPNVGFTGADSLRYVANDGIFDSSVKIVTLNVSANATDTETPSNPSTPTTPTESSSGGGSLSFGYLLILGLLTLFRRKNNGSKFVSFSSLLFSSFFFLWPISVNAAEDCGDEFYINETFPNGARWDMCWEHRDREGIALNAVYFTPKNGLRRMVLNKAAVAQIHRTLR